MHGTTAATNAVLEGRGAKVGVIVTEGFRPPLPPGRGVDARAPLFGWMVYDRPSRCVRIELMAEVRGRMVAGGEECRAARRGERRRRGRRAGRGRRRGGHRLPANSYANPDHERAVRAIVARVAPGLPVSLSSDVLPEFREYERAVTTVMNAYVAPEMDRYLRGLRGRAGRGARARAAGRPLRRRPDEPRRGARDARCTRCFPDRPAASTAPRTSPGWPATSASHLRHGRHVDRRSGLPRRPSR